MIKFWIIYLSSIAVVSALLWFALRRFDIRPQSVVMIAVLFVVFGGMAFLWFIDRIAK